jgi:sugar-specific transcriptional regulator TrmB
VDRLNSQLKEKDRKLGHARQETMKLRQKQDSLRAMILDKSGNEKVSDEQVKEMFLRLRQRIQGIVNRYYNDVSQILEETDALFNHSLRKLPTTRDRKDHVRAKIFETLDNRILSYPCLGISGFELESCSVDKGLAQFESALRSNNGKNGSTCDRTGNLSLLTEISCVYSE